MLELKNPKIAVLGLNPHAGEDGILGDEEMAKSVASEMDVTEMISKSANILSYVLI